MAACPYCHKKFKNEKQFYILSEVNLHSVVRNFGIIGKIRGTHLSFEVGYGCFSNLASDFWILNLVR